MSEKTPAAIPMAALQPLTRAPGRATDYDANKFAGFVQTHRTADEQFGGTCQYVLRDDAADSISLTKAEAKALVDSGVMPPEFLTATGNGMNQHAAHAYDQFAAKVTQAFTEMLANFAGIRGTAAGRFPPVER